MARNSITQGVSLPADLLDQATKAAEAQHRNFSNYVQSLIARDLAAHGMALSSELVNEAEDDQPEED